MKRKLWSVPRIKHPRYPELTVRVGEFQPGGSLHVFRWLNGKEVSRSLRCRRVDLGSTPKAQVQEARRLGAQFIEELVAVPEAPPVVAEARRSLTLSDLADKYEVDGFAGRTESYKRDSLASIRRVAKFLDPDLTIPDLKPSHVQKYMAGRIDEGHAPSGRRDLVAVSVACNWAVGEELIDENPLAKKRARDVMRIDHQPVRPYATAARYKQLKKVARQLPPAFGVLLDIAWYTGNRISAILELRWEHINLTPTEDAKYGTITWYAGAVRNKKRHEHTLHLNEPVYRALRAWRKRSAAVSGLVFPSAKKPDTSLFTTTTREWLREAEDLAELEHVDGGGWHMFRRGWATARKDFPVKDVAAGGGWTDTATVLACYQHATPDDAKAVTTFVA